MFSLLKNGSMLKTKVTDKPRVYRGVYIYTLLS